MKATMAAVTQQLTAYGIPEQRDFDQAGFLLWQKTPTLVEVYFAPETNDERIVAACKTALQDYYNVTDATTPAGWRALHVRAKGGPA